MCPNDNTPPQSGAPEDDGAQRLGRDKSYPLLPLLSESSMATFGQLGDALERVLPLRPKHREDLPAAVRDLSAQLTRERSGLSGGYLQTPRFLSAYAWYFLPWNVYRQARIYAGQWLRLTSGARILDLGSGPLTSVLALWTARPDLRDKELTFVCVDRARKAVRLGMDLFRELGGRWRIEPVDQNLELYLRQPGPAADIALLGNVLNELRWSNFAPLEESVAELAGKVLQRVNLKRKGHVIVIEPGTRFGGKLASLFRKACMEQGLASLSPCTHAEPCPMLEKGAQSWCHFRFEAEGMPDWLQKISQEAKLPKDTLAASFAHLAAVQARQPETGRVLSAPIRLPERQSLGYYVCAKEGLLLLETHRPSLQEGEQTDYELQPGGQRDGKSGALLAQLPGEPEWKPPRTPRGGDRDTRGEGGHRKSGSRDARGEGGHRKPGSRDTRGEESGARGRKQGSRGPRDDGGAPKEERGGGRGPRGERAPRDRKEGESRDRRGQDGPARERKEGDRGPREEKGRERGRKPGGGAARRPGKGGPGPRKPGAGRRPGGKVGQGGSQGGGDGGGKGGEK